MDCLQTVILFVLLLILLSRDDKPSTPQQYVERYEPRTEYLSNYFVDNFYNYSSSNLDKNSNYNTLISNTEASTSGIDLDKIKLDELDPYQYSKLVQIMKGGGQVQLQKNML